MAQIAEAETRISEIELQSLRLADARREEAIGQLRDLSLNERELLERQATLRERLGRLDIIAPVSGTVFGAQVFAEKSVLEPAAPVLYLVPSDQPLRVVARVEPIHVDQVYAGQEVALVFSAFNRNTTPEGVGKTALIGKPEQKANLRERQAVVVQQSLGHRGPGFIDQFTVTRAFIGQSP